MNEDEKSVTQIRAESPFPWMSHEKGMGNLVIVDAAGNEVPLFRVLALMSKLTAHLAAATQAKAEG